MQSNFFNTPPFLGLSDQQIESIKIKTDQVLEKCRLMVEDLAVDTKVNMACQMLTQQGSLGDDMKQHARLCILILSYIDPTARVDDPAVTRNCRETFDSLMDSFKKC